MTALILAVYAHHPAQVAAAFIVGDVQVVLA